MKSRPVPGKERGTADAKGVRLIGSVFKSLFADRDGAPAMVRRLLVEQAAGRWRRYALAFALMATTAACTSLSAYLLRNVINAAYDTRDFHAIVVLASVIVVLPTLL